MGATIVNDVWGLQRDPAMAGVVAENGAMVIVMHNREAVDPAIDIVEDMKRFFERSLGLAWQAGILEDRIVLDPGIGFGKSWAQHLEALRRLPEIRALGFPLLVGVSRKSLLGHIHNAEVPPQERIFGSVASHVMAVAYGADIVRVHDVRQHVEACRVADAIRGRSYE
jgi:dihydropteroate synthase